MKAADSFLLICACIISLPLQAEEVLKLGEEDGWNTISTFNSVTLEPGRGGYHDLLLEEQSYNAGEEGVDLLLHFDAEPFTDAAGLYTAEKDHGVELTETSKFGGGAAKFTQKGGGLDLEPKGGALFGDSSISGSFSIEFWLYPYHLEDGEVLLSWEGQNTLGDELHLQRIRGYVEDRKLTWDFTKIFFSPDSVPRNFTISGTDRIVPRRWHHHLITFDEETGLLEYYLDGRPEAVLYTTDTGREGGTVNLPYFGESSGEPLSIGPETEAIMDELRISRRRVEEPLLDPYTFKKGSGITELIDLDTFGAELLSIDAESAAPPETDVFFFYRLYETMEEAVTGSKEWIPFTPGEDFSSTSEGTPRGRYLQLRFELYPNGRGNRSPSVSSVHITYEPNPAPLAPGYLKAEPGDGRVTLRWNPSMEDDIEGYLIFYGTDTGVYRGRGAEQGDSPIDAGDTTEVVIEGLENGRIHYFAVAAYDSAGIKNRGDLSEEVSARPSPYIEEE
ncbi:MAG: LamG-like jellyroll fold domain-containing protein [Spirochaetaceae bacterium]